MDNGQLRNPFGMIEICKKCPKQLEFFYNRSAADTIIVNCQLSIVNSAKPPNSNLSNHRTIPSGSGKERSQTRYVTACQRRLAAKFQFAGLPDKPGRIYFIITFPERLCKIFQIPNEKVPKKSVCRAAGRQKRNPPVKPGVLHMRA